MNKQYIFTIADLTKKHGQREVLSNIWLAFFPGAKIGVLGRNGAGKSTLLSIMAGEDREFDGEARLTDGFTRGYLPQEPSIFRGLSVEQNIMAILETLPIDSKTRRERLDDLLAELNLTPLRSAPAHTLSGGERRRAEITRALVMSPRFILLDEPFAGIDPIAVSDIQNIVFHLKERGIGVLITDHNVRETLRITDRAYIVHDGVIFRSGTPESLAADEDVRRIYLGTEFRLD